VAPVLKLVQIHCRISETQFALCWCTGWYKRDFKGEGYKKSIEKETENSGNMYHSKFLHHFYWKSPFLIVGRPSENRMFIAHFTSIGRLGTLSLKWPMGIK
jgi:hypothetical protein